MNIILYKLIQLTDFLRKNNKSTNLSLLYIFSSVQFNKYPRSFTVESYIPYEIIFQKKIVNYFYHFLKEEERLFIKFLRFIHTYIVSFTFFLILNAYFS